MLSIRPAFFLALLAGAGHAVAAAPFAEAGVPFLQKHCVSCHGPEKQKGNVSLHQIKDERTLLRARRQWKDVLNLVQSGEMPPEDAREQPTAEERKRFLESAMSAFARADQAPPDPGRRTLRRLNRTEYNNTIRDLLNVEFRPADNFPSDDVGYGFDNIADVLSVSPVLMDRYLEAAASIAEQAIPLTAALPPKRTMAGMFCEPASPAVPQDRFRPLWAAEKDLVLSGPLHTPARVMPDNEYVMRVRLFARSAGGEPVKIALLLVGANISNPASAAEIARLDGAAMPALKSCAILKIAEVTAREESQAQVFEARISARAGVERIAVAALKPASGPPPKLFVEWLECEGPLDPRSPTTKALMVFSPDKSPRDQARQVLGRFVSRAWRRPVTKDELDRLTGLMEYTVGHAESWEEALRRAITAVLASPKFIFRLEPDDQPDNPAAHSLDDFQLATRLSYFLWSSCPDDELLRLAAQRKLIGNLQPQIQRMLKDPRASALVENFAVQWLQIGRLVGHSADAKTFPRWQPELRASMLEETRRFCAEIFREDRSILDLLDADFTWVDRRLAELYKLQPPGGFRGDEWKRVALAGTPRGGLLTQASVLTVTSNPTRTSPVKRGKWVLEQLLGAPPPPAPPNIPSLDDAQRKELTGTFRQKLEQHRHDVKCAGCHEKMDAFGFTLENFDGIGQWRDRDETGAPVDASAKLSGHPLAGLPDLKATLREHQRDFTRCFTEKMLIYALGRGLDYYDEPAIDRIQSALARNDFRFSVLVSEIAKSTPFLLRRGQSQIEPTTEKTSP